MDRTEKGFITEVVQGDRSFGVEHGGVHKPIHTSVQYGCDKVEDLIGVFQGTLKGGYNYARQGTPTTSALEAKLTRMEQGVGTVWFATGMAAITALFLTLLPEVLRGLKDFRLVVNGMLLIVIILFLPRGLWDPARFKRMFGGAKPADVKGDAK